MRARIQTACVLAMIALCGCVAGLERERPFSKSWADHQRHERDFAERKARIRGEEGLVLLGNPQKNRAALLMDEESGRPRLDIGRKTGWSLDLRYDKAAEAAIKYKLKWDFAKPKTNKDAPREAAHQAK